jgi:Fe-S-cluster-containing hydrogenase component 2
MNVNKRKRGKAIIECHQEIPCNPCELACRNGAIKVGSSITTPPVFHAERCKGCGDCIPLCPGLAIFLFDPSYSEREALVAFPHEYLPLPQKGREVEVVDRTGVVLGKGIVLKVDSEASNDRTPVLYVAVPRDIGKRVRGMSRAS